MSNNVLMAYLASFEWYVVGLFDISEYVTGINIYNSELDRYTTSTSYDLEQAVLCGVVHVYWVIVGSSFNSMYIFYI